MAPKYALCSLAAVAAVSTHASAAILIFTNEFLYDANTTSYGSASENFDSYGGSYPSGLSGNAGPIAWNAASTGGVSVTGGRLSGAGTSPLTISFGSGGNVYGVGGNFFGTDGSNAVVASLVLVSLNDGTSYLNLIDTSTVFVGFVSTGASISSIQITAQTVGGTSVFANADNVKFAYVPAPGALALLGLAGLAGSRRRR
jgi:hypothetical protein